MKRLTQYIVDAFTDKVFAGNPAAVCVLDQWLPEETCWALPGRITYRKPPSP